MRKNSYVIEQAKQLEKLKKHITNVIPEIYACFAKVLYRRGCTPDEIEDIFMETQQVWNENVDRMDSMIEWVADTTGIELRSDAFIGGADE